ncbi:MAG TPA: DUF2157 domain-containing protein [Calditrichia bacterium]|nr:DUF2157 domain-containing protein [Calditrichia bacterium]HQV31199.1 DUF2157 domain-containing protein [Calditrichia bacterium]
MLPLPRPGQFREEIEAWVKEGIITPEQAQLLINRYHLDDDPPWYRQSGFILKALAILLAGMALLLVISQNWHHLSLFARSAVGLIPLLTAYAIGLFYFLRGEEDSAELALFFAGIALGANIFLQAQIYHISAYFPDGILWWMIGLFPVAWLFRSRLHLGGILFLFLIWISQQLQFHQLSYLGLVLFAGLLYLVRQLPHRILLTAMLASTVMVLWNLDWHLNGRTQSDWILMSVLFAGGLSALLEFVKDPYPEDFIARLRQGALVFLLMILLGLTFEADIRTDSPFPLLPTLMGLSAIGLSFRGRTSEQQKWIGGLTAVIWTFAIVWHFSPHRETSIALQTIANILFLGIGASWVYFGLQKGVKKTFMGGIILLAILAVARYFDLISNYLVTAALMIFFSLLIYAANRYWDKRYAS